MRILFVHQAFPGPFQYLAGLLGSMPRTTVLFLSERQRREVKIPGVRSLSISPPKVEENHDPVEREMLLALRRGANTANALLRLQRGGFRPDIVCTSSGGGYGLYATDVFPDAFHAVYADWFYTKGANYTFFNDGKPRSPADFAPARARNWCQLNALAECDLAFTFTKWQKSQFSGPFADSIHVVRQGVDTQFFAPRRGDNAQFDGYPLPADAEFVTFAGRSLEPSRGFGQFAKCVPALLAARPKCHVLIMAGASNGDSVEDPIAMPETLKALSPEDSARVHFLGFRPYAEYRDLLRISTVHVYLTAPFALSSGLFEAMSCGCLMVGADTEPVREVITYGKNGFLCDFWDADALAAIVIGLLQKKDQMLPIRQAARQTIVESYNIKKQGQQHMDLLLRSYAKWKGKPVSPVSPARPAQQVQPKLF